MDVKAVKTVKILKADTFIIFKSFIVFMGWLLDPAVQDCEGATGLRFC